MTATAAEQIEKRPRTKKRGGLFVTDAELIERLQVPEKIARRTIEMLDRDPRSGFPKKQKIWGDRRYWPAVEQWLEHTTTATLAPPPPHELILAERERCIEIARSLMDASDEFAWQKACEQIAIAIEIGATVEPVRGLYDQLTAEQQEAARKYEGADSPIGHQVTDGTEHSHSRRMPILEAEAALPPSVVGATQCPKCWGVGTYPFNPHHACVMCHGTGVLR